MNIYLERVDQQVNCCRYYTMHIEPDLFAEHALIARWGRIGTRGQSKVMGSGTFVQCTALKNRILAVRLKRGYRPAL